MVERVPINRARAQDLTLMASSAWMFLANSRPGYI